MHATAARIVLLVSVALALVAAGSASATPKPGACQEDTKLIGPILLSTENVEGTWWHLTRGGFIDAGITEENDQKAMLEGAFGMPFLTLDDAVVTLVAAVEPLDKNGNGYVCASTLRGTKAFFGDPNFAYYIFGVIDDKHVKN